jgi:hypothetical protein
MAGATMNSYAELTVSLERHDSTTFAVDVRFTSPDNDAERGGRSEGHSLAVDELEALVDDPSAYGRRLGQDVFAFPDIREVFAIVQTLGVPLRFRLSIPPNDKDLQGLLWETLADPDAPEPSSPLLMSDQILFSRFVDSRDWRQVARRTRGDVRALVVVSNPSDLASYRLAPIDVPGEIERARDGMKGGVGIDFLGESDRATLNNIADRMRTGVDILYLVCHGAIVDGKSVLWLEDEAGASDKRDGSELVTRLRELAQPPRLVVLISCQSAGRAGSDALGALGPKLGASGVPAVLAMHGNVTMATMKAFMPKFFSELKKDGQIDRAVALARSEVRDRPDVWSPVLYMRLKSGSVWSQSGFARDQSGRVYQGWPALINHINQGNCTPILGHGLTEPLIGPRREIARRWADSYHFPLAPQDQEDLPQVAQFVYVNSKDTMLLLDQLDKSVRESLVGQLGSDAPDGIRGATIDDLLLELGKRRWAVDSDEPHWVLAQAPFPVFVTTALDCLLVEALKAVDKKPRAELFRWKDQANWPPSVFEEDPGYVPSVEEPLVYHLFGRLGVEGSLVITEDDYFDYLIGATRKRNEIPSVVRARLVETALLFLGFEMDGWDFRVLFRSIMNRAERPISEWKRIAHAGVQVDLVEDKILEIEGARQYLQSYFQDSNIHIFWGSVADFARDLRLQREKLS